jgi:hypothetical protein
MASKISLEVKYNNLPQFAKNLNPAILAALDRGVARVEQDATANANFLTGALRASHYRITPLHDGFDAAVQAFNRVKPDGETVERPEVPPGGLIVGFAASYAIFPHDGVNGRAGNPFLTMAAEAHKQDIVEDVQTAVSQLVQRYGKK